MTKNCPHRDPPPCKGIARYRIVSDVLIAGVVFLTFANICDAAGPEQLVINADPLKPDFSVPRSHEWVPQSHELFSSTLFSPSTYSMSAYSLPSSYVAAELPPVQSFPEQDFRPRGHSVLEKTAPDSTFVDAPMLHGTTVWQRMADYRARGRVRVLTLWENGGSTVALLAGKRGEPSLQWTSRSMNRGGATRGLLDEIFSTSIAGAARGLQFSPRMGGGGGGESASKPARMQPAAASPSR